MKNLMILLFCFTPALVKAGNIVGGVIVADHYTCSTYDRIVIETRRGFSNAEVYSGYSSTVEGRIIFGDLESYGFTEIYDEDGDEVGRLYIDDYMVSKSTAEEWCFE